MAQLRASTKNFCVRISASLSRFEPSHLVSTTVLSVQQPNLLGGMMTFKDFFNGGKILFCRADNRLTKTVTIYLHLFLVEFSVTSSLTLSQRGASREADSAELIYTTRGSSLRHRTPPPPQSAKCIYQYSGTVTAFAPPLQQTAGSTINT
jgi:hypothetical protein